jgi:hypothetical protein
MWHRRRTDDGDDEQEQESVLPSGAFVRAAVGRVPGGGGHSVGEESGKEGRVLTSSACKWSA